MITIKDIKLSVGTDYKELSAVVDGSDVWFKFPIWANVTPRAEIFLPLAISEAMVRGEDVSIPADTPISRQLAESLPRIVSIFCCWNSDDNQPIQIRAETECSQRNSESLICCFSGGIDSSFSLAQHQAEITDLLVVMGFDASSQGIEWDHLVQRLNEQATKNGKRLIWVETNLRKVFESRLLSWEASHGSVLASIGVALRARSIIIPSSDTYEDLSPWGSHPMLDPLWSTEATCVVHDDIGFSRTQKTAGLIQHPALLDELQVCWEHWDRNCGQCSKCLRTSLALYMLGGKSARLPGYDGASSLIKLKPKSMGSISHLDDLIVLAKRTNHIQIARELIGYRDRFLFRYHVIESLRALLGNRGRRLSRMLSKKSWHNARTKIKGGQVTLEN